MSRFMMPVVAGLMSIIATLGCKRQPVRASSPEEDFGSSQFSNLASPDGNLKSLARTDKLSDCSDPNGAPLIFNVADRRFYRCTNHTWIAIDRSQNVADGCRSFDLLVDVAGTAGAQPESNVKFLGVSCESMTYLLKEENGLLPVLSSASIHLGDKEILLRASFFQSKLGETLGQSIASTLFLERPTSLKWHTIPEKIEVSAGGHAGRGKFAMIAFNSGSTLCSYRSDGAEAYSLRGCWDGAVEDSSADSGVAGGRPVDLSSKALISLDSVRLSIIGAEPGFITSAVVSLFFE